VALAHPRGGCSRAGRGCVQTGRCVRGGRRRRGTPRGERLPRRQDLDPTLLALARQAGCRFLLASDAHHPRHLAFEATAVALAAQAGVAGSAIVNFEPLDHLVAGRPDLVTP